VRHSRTLSNEELAYVHAEQALAKVSSTSTGEHAFTISCASTQPSDTCTGEHAFTLSCACTQPSDTPNKLTRR
jgi:hypothetical protein